jgi:hypothetical protein
MKILAPGSPQNTSVSAPDFTLSIAFTPLPVDPLPDVPASNTTEEVHKPPSIFVKNLENFNHLCTAQSAAIGVGNFK